MDDELALRRIEADLERDDPRLARRLSGPPPGPRLRWFVTALLLIPPLLALVFVVAEAAFGAVLMVLVAATPLIVLWFLPPPGDGSAPRPT
jgi:hypothetical protein